MAVFLVVPAEDHDDPVEWLAPCLRQPGCQVRDLTRGFASPPRGGFAFIERGLPSRRALRKGGAQRRLRRVKGRQILENAGTRAAEGRSDPLVLVERAKGMFEGEPANL